MQYSSTLGPLTLTVDIPENNQDGMVDVNLSGHITPVDIKVPKQELRDVVYQLLGLLTASTEVEDA